MLFEAIGKSCEEGGQSIATLDSLCEHVLQHSSAPVAANLEADLAAAEIDRTAKLALESDSEEEDSDTESLKSAAVEDDKMRDTDLTDEDEDCYL